jgi:hypothetical protein
VLVIEIPLLRCSLNTFGTMFLNVFYFQNFVGKKKKVFKNFGLTKNLAVVSDFCISFNLLILETQKTCLIKSLNGKILHVLKNKFSSLAFLSNF